MGHRTQTLGMIAALILLLMSSLNAENSIAITKASDGSVAVRLSSTKAVSAVQFVVSASNIQLTSVNRFGSTLDSRWQMSTYRANDSTVNVVIYTVGNVQIPAGEGTIAIIKYADLHSGNFRRAISITKVLASDSKSNGIFVSGASMEWSPEAALPRVETASLQGNYPNPFNPSTKIKYTLNESSAVSLTIYDINGREVSSLVNTIQSSGEYSIVWDAANNLSSGTYIACLRAGSYTRITKMLLAR